MSEKAVIPYRRVIGDIVIGKGVAYVMNYDPEIYGFSPAVISYDEVTEIFETEDTVYAPA